MKLASAKIRAPKILAILKKNYPDADCELHHRNPFELLISIILSAQCTDKRVNMVTPELFKKYPTPKTLAKGKLSDIEKLIRSTGFFKNKAKSIKGCAEGIVRHHHGNVPQTLEELTKLPGIGRKTANALLGHAFGIPGIVVDTHMIRLATRLGLTKQKHPEKIERDLMPLLPQKDWTIFSSCIIFHGRRCCSARKPACSNCPVASLCPSAGIGV